MTRSSTLRDRSDALFDRYVRTHDPHIRERLIIAHQSLAYKLAGKFAGHGESVDDLAQVAMIGLIKAIDHFAPSRHTRFSTYAVPTIIGEIKRYFRDCSWIIKVPRDLKELNAAAAKASEVLNSTSGHPASVREICNLMGVSEEMLHRARGLDAVRHPLSLSGPASVGTPDDGLSIGDTIGAEDEGLNSALNRIDLRRGIDQLDPMEKTIILQSYFGGKSQTELSRSLHMSQMQVSRVHQRALSHLRNQFSSGWRLPTGTSAPLVRLSLGVAAKTGRRPARKTL